MKLSASQIKTIALLNLVLLIIVGAIAAEMLLARASVEVPDGPADTVDAPADVPPEKVPYSLLRGARKGNGNVIFETTLGGSGNDEAVAAFSDGDSLFVFGNTASDDFDMTGADGRAFMMTLDEDLAVTGRAFLGLAGEKTAGVVPAEGGFLCSLGDGNSVRLVLVGKSGEVLAEVAAGEKERFADLIAMNAGYALVTALDYAFDGRTALVFRLYSAALELRYERIVTTPYSLTYAECFELRDSVVVFYGARSDLGSHVGAAVLTQSTAVMIHRLSGGGNCEAIAVVPFGGGYAVAARFEDGGAGIMLVGVELAVKKIVYSGEAGYDSCSFFYAGGEYYCSFFGGGRRATIAYDAEFGSGRLVPELDPYAEIFGCYGGTDPLFACSDGSLLAAVDAKGLATEFGSAACLGLTLLVTDRAVYAMSSVSAAGGSVGDTFGGADVWLAKLEIPGRFKAQ